MMVSDGLMEFLIKKLSEKQFLDVATENIFNFNLISRPLLFKLC